MVKNSLTMPNQGKAPHDRPAELLIAALRKAGTIIAKYLESGATLAPTDHAQETIRQLIAALDNEDLARAIERLEKGHGLRVVK
jgi:hypothetical protein